MCAKHCSQDYDLHREGDFLVFYNFTSSADDVLVHFLCEDDPCDDSCTLVSIVASYRITFISKFYRPDKIMLATSLSLSLSL